jgi:hypothetical protein
MGRLAPMLMAIALLAGSVALAGSAPAQTERGGNFAFSRVASFREFPLYSLGEAFEGLPLTAVYRIDGPSYPGESVRRDDVTFVYGTCKADGPSGCLPPLQVQSWSACERHRGAYRFKPDTAIAVRGRSAALYENGTRLELSFPGTTVVVYAADPKLLRRAAEALKAANSQGGTSCKAG